MGLLLNSQRQRTRRSYDMLRAIKDAFEPTVPAEYFAALYDDPEEAEAMYAIHADRVAAAQQQTEPIPTPTPA